MENKGFITAIIVSYVTIAVIVLAGFFYMNKTTINSITAVETIAETSIKTTVENLKGPEPLTEEKIFNNMLDICVNKESAQIANAVRHVSYKYDVPVDVIYTVMFVETSSRTGEFSGKVKIDATSSASCRGLMQLSKDAVNEYIWKTNSKHSYDEIVNNIELSIDAGVWYLAERYKDWPYIKNASWEYQYLLYNFGPTNYKFWLENGMPDSIQFPQYNHVTDVRALRTRFCYFDYQVRQRLYKVVQ